MKKHAPIQKLKEAGKFANDLLVKKGIVSKINLLEEIKKEANAPILPGVPSYLPHKWTIDASQRIMFDILSEWLNENNHNQFKIDDFPKFITFAIKRMNHEEKKAEKEILKNYKVVKSAEESRLLSDIFSPLQKKQTIKSLNKFFVDSFAVSVIVKKNESTSTYADWFLNDWTVSLKKLWSKRDGNNTK